MRIWWSSTPTASGASLRRASTTSPAAANGSLPPHAAWSTSSSEVARSSAPDGSPRRDPARCCDPVGTPTRSLSPTSGGSGPVDDEGRPADGGSVVGGEVRDGGGDLGGV